MPDLIIPNGISLTQIAAETYIVPRIVANIESGFYVYFNFKGTFIDTTGINTKNAKNFNRMFYFCQNLKELDLSNFYTSNATDMNGMFDYCTSLTKLDIRNFDFSKVTSYNNMFNRVPDDCLIIVKDDTAKEWITSKFTTLTNVKTVAELEAA